MNNKNIYIIGSDCFVKALQQMLALYYSNCNRLEELPSNKDEIPIFSIIICTPSILSTPARIIQIYHELFGGGIIDCSNIIGIFNQQNEVVEVNKTDIFGGFITNLMVNKIKGINVFASPNKLTQLLQFIENSESNILSFENYFDYKRKNSSLIKVKEQLQNIIKDNRVLNINESTKLREELHQINLDFIIGHKKTTKLKEILPANPNIDELKIPNIDQLKIIVKLLP